MSISNSSRRQILDRIRGATPSAVRGLADATVGYASLPRRYVRAGTLRLDARLALMTERLRDYDAEVVACMPEELQRTIAARISSSGRRRFVVSDGLPAEWLMAGVDFTIDYHLIAGEIEHAEGVISAAFCGIADSGTIVLHHSGPEGRRVLTLLPDWHLIVLRASQVVETLPEYFDRCGQPPVLATYITGPSATADIEMTRIKGVHGPRIFQVILVRDETAA
jgi:L-lactate dehydrogenase complex protein LldG